MRKFAVIGMAVAIAAGLSACSSSSKSGELHDDPHTTAAALAPECGNAPKPRRGRRTSSRSWPAPSRSSPACPARASGKAATPTRPRSPRATSTTSPSAWRPTSGSRRSASATSGFDAIVAGTHHELRPRALADLDHGRRGPRSSSFSTPYFQSNQGILMKAGKSISTLAQAKKLNWGVQTGTTAIDLLKKIGVRTRTPTSSSPTRTPRSKRARSTRSSSTPRSTSVRRLARRASSTSWRSSTSPAVPTSTARSSRRAPPTSPRSTRCSRA